MLPASQSLLQAFANRLLPLHLTLLATAMVVPGSAGTAYAQDIGNDDPTTNANTESDEPVAFEADRVEYLTDDETVIASGNVVLRRSDQSVRADKVTWNRNTGVIMADGDVRLLDQDGNQLYTEHAELTDELKTGAMENMLLALRAGGRLAADSGRRLENGDVILSQAAYTACEVEDENRCPTTPSWRVTAREVIFDADRKRISFIGARVTFFGVITVPIPGLKTTTDGRALSGLLIPDFRTSPSNGLEISDSYFVRLADNRDITATAFLYTEAPPMVSGQYRALTESGAYQITGYATKSRRSGIEDSAPTSENDFRGYLFANGRFQVSPRWTVTGSLRRATDRTFLRRYDIVRDDRLRSTADLERIGKESYLSIAGWATQTMRVGASQGQMPVALPAIDYRHRIDDPILGGRIELQGNSLAIMRSAGQDTQRAFARAQWDLRRVTGMGQEITLTTLLRADVYHSNDNELSPTAFYRGEEGWQTRAVAVAAVDVKWPFVGKLLNGTQVLTPRFQLVATPSIGNLAIPNEDARAIDLEDSNLFALNRFPGYDRIEDGVRFTYGLDWQFEKPRWRIKTVVGQSVRLSQKPTLFPDGTGLTDPLSDFVGRTEVRYRNFVSLIHRFRIDKDSFAIRRQEFDAVIGDHRTYAELGYIKLNRDIAAGIEDLEDHEEVRAAGRVAFARYWSVFGSGVVNLTDRREDPILGSDGFQPLRTRVGVAYQDDCLEVAFTWRRDYVSTGDAEKGDSFQVRFALRNIGFR